MPTYSYQCKDCGHRYDAFQSISADPDTDCPKCGGAVQRVIGGGSGIVFKGSGFYVTDYKKDSGGSGASASSSGSGSSDSKAAGSSASSD